MSARETVVLARAVARRTVQLRRPLVDALWGVVVVAALAAAVLLGPWSLSPGRVVVGAVVLLSALVAATDLPRELAAEVRSGTVAQLLTSPLGIGRVALVRAGVSLALALGSGLALFVVLGGTGAQVRPTPAAALVWVLAVLSALGLGLALGGLALVHERVEAALQFVPLLVLALVVAPVETVPALRYVPLALGRHLVERSVVHGAGIPLDSLLLVAATACGSLLGGWLLLRAAVRRARTTGSFGGY